MRRKNVETKLKARERRLVLKRNLASSDFRDFLEDLGIPFKWEATTAKHFGKKEKDLIALVTVTCDILLYRRLLIELKRLYEEHGYELNVWFLE